jgi:hypothetical protein
VGTTGRNKGTHSSNIFSLTGGMLQGPTYYKVAMKSSNTNYTVTQVRKNK